jgi:hypothetical protein
LEEDLNPKSFLTTSSKAEFYPRPWAIESIRFKNFSSRLFDSNLELNRSQKSSLHFDGQLESIQSLWLQVHIRQFHITCKNEWIGLHPKNPTKPKTV